MMTNKTFHEIINILFLISWLIIILSTLTVLIIIIRYWRHQCRSVVNLLMCNSSASLLFLAITYSIQTPSFIQQIYFDAPEPSPLFCKISACLATFSTGVVAHSCIVQAVSRFFMTVVYKYKHLLTYRTNWIIIITSCVVNGVVAVGMFISPLAYQYDPESHFCTLTTHNFLTSTIISILFVAVTVILLVVLYGIILHHTIYHTHINPNSESTLRARRNKRVFQNIIFSVSVHAVGGIPYIICIIMNRTGQASWPLYSIAVLSLSFTSAIHSVFLLVINDQVKRILFVKLTGHRTNASSTTGTRKRNQVTPCLEQIRTIEALPTIS
jgi:hypothetical protein